jgi:hypothetical protein
MQALAHRLATGSLRVPTKRTPLVPVYTAVIERDPNTAWYIGYVPGFPGAHSQGTSLDELHQNRQQVIARLESLGFVEVRQRGSAHTAHPPITRRPMARDPVASDPSCVAITSSVPRASRHSNAVDK